MTFKDQLRYELTRPEASRQREQEIIEGAERIIRQADRELAKIDNFLKEIRHENYKI